MVISSDMLLTALLSISSARLNASFTGMRVLEYMSHNRSLFTMSRASTFLRISSTPFNALMIFFSFSK